jgi:hypothetical protein
MRVRVVGILVIKFSGGREEKCAVIIASAGSYAMHIF